MKSNEKQEVKTQEQGGSRYVQIRNTYVYISIIIIIELIFYLFF